MMARPFRDRHDDPLNAARGITVALPVTLIMWAFIAWMMWGGLSSALSYSAKQKLVDQERFVADARTANGGRP